MSRKVNGRRPRSGGRGRDAEAVECQRWTFAVDMDRYAGNFERELGEYVTGLANPYRSCEALVAQARRELGLEEAAAEQTGPFAGLFERRVNESGADVATFEVATVLPTPGWSAAGGGYHRVLKGRPSEEPAFLSVGIFLARKPTPRQLVLLVERAWRFGRVARRHCLGEGPKVTGCRLMRETVRVESWQVRVVGGRGQRQVQLRRIREAKEWASTGVSHV